MKTAHPFAFSRDGKFSSPFLTVFISVRGLKHLNSSNLDPDEKKAVEALNAAVQTFVVNELWSTTFTHDAPANKLEKIMNWPSNNWTGEYYKTSKKSYAVVDLGPWGKNYSPEHNIETITAHPNSWGWAALERLQPHSAMLRKISKKYQVHIEVKLIDRARKFQQALNAGEMSTRTADSVSDFGRAEGFAVFLGRGYADFQWCANTIEKAKLFGSENLAREAIKNNRASNNAVVVKVETSLKEICDTQASLQNTSALTEALSALQKERLENALQSAELETLRAYVAQLEKNTGSQQAPTQKRKM